MIRLLPIVFDIVALKIKFNIQPGLIFENLWYSGFAAIVMGLAGLLMKKLSDNIVWQFCSVGICMLIYFGIQVVNPKTRRDVKDLRGLNKN